MTYVAYINGLLKKMLMKTRNVVCFGQNIITGSCLGGLTRGLPSENGNLFINTTNSEYTLTGAGFGLMIEGMHGIYFMKQQDFLLLGVDHLVHTWNSMRLKKPQGSFTIFPTIVDNGYEGSQSCINTLPDLCSISRIPAFTISNKEDADAVLDKHLFASGVRIIGVSQNLGKSEMFDEECDLVDVDNMIHRYGTGKDATVVSLNFAYSEAKRFTAVLANEKIDASLFNVSATTPTSWSSILDHAARSKRVVICDDSKSMHKTSTELGYLLKSQISDCEISIQNRTYDQSWCVPNSDKYVVKDHQIFETFSFSN